MEEINKLMDEEIVSQIKGLKTLQAGSQEQTAAVKNLTALYEARINQEKVQLDADDKREKREMEREQHRADETLRKSQVADEAAAGSATSSLRRPKRRTRKSTGWFGLALRCWGSDCLWCATGTGSGRASSSRRPAASHRL